MMNKWTSVTDKLPEPFVSVLAYVPDEAPLQTVHEGYMDPDGKWHLVHSFYQLSANVTHWMALPLPPEM